MATDDYNYKQEINLRHLPTDSVTLLPTRAHVTRVINDINLKAGANEVTLFGITPSADEGSIKVDGKGTATITDMMVELVPNPENFDDVYPPESDDDSSSDEEPEAEKPDYLRSAEDAVEKLENRRRITSNALETSTGQLDMLDNYVKTVEKDRPLQLSDCLLSYREGRERALTDQAEAQQKLFEIQEQEPALHLTKRNAERRWNLELKKAGKEKAKQKEVEARELQKKRDLRERIRLERTSFWPKKVYRVVLSLDVATDSTPMSSRRESVSSVATSIKDVLLHGSQVSLTLSYVTSFASWAPRYDISLNTSTGSGTVIYRAEFLNSTSETWKDTKVVLSTSETALGGLTDVIPQMHPWLLRLVKSAYKNQGHDNLSALLSSEEQLAKSRISGLSQQNQVSQTLRSELFGTSKSVCAKPPPPGSFSRGSMCAKKAHAPSAFDQSLPALSRSRGAVFGGSHPAPASAMSVQEALVDSDDAEEGKTMVPDLPAIDMQESSWSEAGLTASYDIPGLKTIMPSLTTRRQKITSIHLKDIHFSYLTIPKLRADAFLKARIRNTSNISLLRGAAGLTLDGSFLGNTRIPRCSAGDTMSLSLGIDPSVKVTYAQPTTKRGSSGIISKEGNGLFNRLVTVINTKPNRTIEGLVLDQVPISEDDRLRVEILNPRVARVGDKTKHGQGIDTANKPVADWGKAVAELKKGGEICWDFKLNAGKGVKLALDYEARYPGSEYVVSV